MITSAVYPGISCLILFILNLTIVQLTINYSLYQPWLLLLKTVQVWIMLLELLLVKRAPSFCFYFYEHSDRDCLTELQLWPQIILFNVTKPCHQPSFLNKANGMYPCYSFIWLLNFVHLREWLSYFFLLSLMYRTAHHNRNVSWLRRTEYISTEYNRSRTSNEMVETKYVKLLNPIKKPS